MKAQLCNHVLNNFMSLVAAEKGRDKQCKIIWEDLQEAKKIRTQLINAKRTGAQCREKAVWIGVERYWTKSRTPPLVDKMIRKNEAQINKWMAKSMVESDHQVRTGIASGAFKADEYTRVDLCMNRCNAPEQRTAAVSIIFWEKESVGDTKPNWDKVVRTSLYNG